MIRYIALSLMLLPGVAQAQKFVSVDGEEAPIQTISEDGSTDAAPEVDDGYGESIVINDTTDLDLPQVVVQEGTAGQTTVSGNSIVALVVVDADGESVLALSTAGSTQEITDGDASSTDAANFEVGECNDGTDWSNNEAHCWNYYPVDDED